MRNSEIDNCPDPGFDPTEGVPSAEYEAWVEKITKEPWVAALDGLVEPTGRWVGTEEGLIRALEARAGNEAWQAEDFPTSLDMLYEYMDKAEVAMRRLDLYVLDYRDSPWTSSGAPSHSSPGCRPEDEYDAPGWGHDAPVLVFRESTLPLDHFWALNRVLEAWDPFALALFLFTSSEDFGAGRRWEGTTTALANALREHHPNDAGALEYVAKWHRPAGAGALPDYGSAEERAKVLEPRGTKDLAAFRERMAESLPVLEGVGIEVRLEDTGPNPAGPTDTSGEDRWVVEAPRWLDKYV